MAYGAFGTALTLSHVLFRDKKKRTGDRHTPSSLELQSCCGLYDHRHNGRHVRFHCTKGHRRLSTASLTGKTLQAPNAPEQSDVPFSHDVARRSEVGRWKETWCIRRGRVRGHAIGLTALRS